MFEIINETESPVWEKWKNLFGPVNIRSEWAGRGGNNWTRLHTDKVKSPEKTRKEIEDFWLPAGSLTLASLFQGERIIQGARLQNISTIRFTEDEDPEETLLIDIFLLVKRECRFQRHITNGRYASGLALINHDFTRIMFPYSRGIDFWAKSEQDLSAIKKRFLTLIPTTASGL